MRSHQSSVTRNVNKDIDIKLSTNSGSDEYVISVPIWLALYRKNCLIFEFQIGIFKQCGLMLKMFRISLHLLTFQLTKT